MQVSRHESMRAIPWEGGKAEARLLDSLGLTAVARAAAAQVAADLDQSLRSKRSGLRPGRRTSSTDTGIQPVLRPRSYMPCSADRLGVSLRSV